MVMVMVMEDVTTVTAVTVGPPWVVTAVMVGPLWVVNTNSEKAPFRALFSFFRNFAAISS